MNATFFLWQILLIVSLIAVTKCQPITDGEAPVKTFNIFDRINEGLAKVNKIQDSTIKILENWLRRVDSDLSVRTSMSDTKRATLLELSENIRESLHKIHENNDHIQESSTQKSEPSSSSSSISSGINTRRNFNYDSGDAFNSGTIYIPDTSYSSGGYNSNGYNSNPSDNSGVRLSLFLS